MDTLTYTVTHTLGAIFSAASLAYLGLLYALGLAALPLCHRLFPRSRILWVAAARPLGLALLIWVAWVLGHNAFGWSPANVEAEGAARLLKLLLGNGAGLLPYTGLALWMLLLVGLAVSAWAWKKEFRAIGERARRVWPALAVGEAVFLIVFGFAIVLRMHSHGIQQQEKYMDFAFLNSCIYSPQLPPPDPWRYEGHINYYYGGYLMMSAPAKMTGIRPEYAYNLAVGVVFSMTALLAFALGFELTRRVHWALLAVLAVAFMSNLKPLTEHWDHGDRKGKPILSVDWWSASRVIRDGPSPDKQGDTINEFPFFAFYHADLHPHMVAQPWVLLFLGFLLEMLRASRGAARLQPRARPGPFGRGVGGWVRLGFTAWALGTLAITNGFDFITFSFVFGMVLLVREWIAGRGWRGEAALNMWAIAAAVLLGLAAVAWKGRGALVKAAGGEPPRSGGLLLAAAVLWGVGALAVLALLIMLWWRSGRRDFHLLRVARRGALVIGLAVLLYAPFFINFHAPIRPEPFRTPAKGESPLGALWDHATKDLMLRVTDYQSGPGEFLTVWATQLVALVALALAGFSRFAWLKRLRPETRGFVYGAVGLAWLVLVFFAGGVVFCTLLLLAGALLAGLVACRKRPERVFVFVAALAAVIILAGVERVAFRDIYGDLLQRMNTLFKFYFPVWIMLGVCLPFCLRDLLRSRTVDPVRRWGLTAATLALVVVALEYCVATSGERLDHYRTHPVEKPTLDGMAYMRRGHPGDHAAILWLRENVRPDEVVLEAPASGGYAYESRVSTHTPLRAVVGWAGHERIWRGDYPGQLFNDAKNALTLPSMDAVEKILKTYGVDYVYVGAVERKDYPTAGLKKFDEAYGPPIYDKADVRIYRVPKAGEAHPAAAGSGGAGS